MRILNDGVRAGASFLVMPVPRAVLLDTIAKALAGGADDGSRPSTMLGATPSQVEGSGLTIARGRLTRLTDWR